MVEQALKLITEIQHSLIQEYAFLDQWNVKLDNAKKRAGICRLSEREISISLQHILNNDIQTVEDTILHEFAHAIAYQVYKETGHGHYWKLVARKIGATPKASGKFELPSAPWLLVHVCNESANIYPIAERFRRNKKIRNYHLSGRPETKGELFFVAQTDFNQYKHGLLDKSRLVLVQ